MKRSAAITLAMLGIAACAVPAWATYSVPISSFSEGTGRASAGQYEIAFTVGQASPIGTAAAGAFALASGIVPTTMDLAPPVILHTPRQLVAAREAVAIEADIEDQVTGVDSVVLYYHEGGLTSFKTVPMEVKSGSTYEADIPAAALTERGLVYYIEATDGMGNVSTVPDGAPDSLQNLPVYFASLVSDMNMPSGQHRMISIPGTPTNGSPDSVLVDDYGSYDRTSWRLGRWNTDGGCTTGCYDEYPDIADLAPGRAYWLILRTSRMFDFSGISTDVSRPSPIHLEQGWNQIGTPYAFGTRWSTGWVSFDGQRYAIGAEHVVGADTIMVEDNLIAYSGSYESFQTHVGVWTGYWVYNGSTAEVDLEFPPVMAAAGALEAPLAGRDMDALFSLVTTERREGDEPPISVCYAGLAEGARDAWDSRDLHSPPPLEGHLSASFRKDGWGRHSGAYMTDIRSISGNGQTYVLTIESPVETNVTVEVRRLGDLPEGWGAALYDRARGIKVTDLAEPLVLNVPGRAAVELALGTEEFIAGEEIESNMELRTHLLSLMPNPFVEDLTVSFHLGSPQQVSVEIFNIEGARVAHLADEVLGAGMHSRMWDGRTPSGQAAAPGVYFLRMRTEDTTSSGKIIKLR